MTTVAVAIFCKTPAPGASKTRLSPPLSPDECAAVSACFIHDLSQTIAEASRACGATPYALYTPHGSENELRKLLPPETQLMLQSTDDFGGRLLQGVTDFLAHGHSGAILLNSDSPTLPKSIIIDAVKAVSRGDNVTLSPAYDGGYTLIGASKPHARLFDDIPWSTSEVFERTVERAEEIGLAVETVPGWYDVDDAETYQMLEQEIMGTRPSFLPSGLIGADAPRTRRFVLQRRSRAANVA